MADEPSGDAHHLIVDELPDHPGWRRWQFSDPTRFNQLMGPMMFRVDGAVARVRWTPGHRHSNLSENVHGGALLGFIDVALFAASRGFGLIAAGTAVTLDLNTQFLTGGRVGEPLEAQVELLRETGRLLFLRGLVVQGEDESRIAAFSGTIRKPGGRPSSPSCSASPSGPLPLPAGEGRRRAAPEG